MQQVFSGPRPLVRMLKKVMKPALRQRSFTEASIILDWHKIINSELAMRCYPERLIFSRGKKEGGVLVIAVDSGSSLLLQHSETLLIEWINSYFGYQAVNRIKLKHTYIPRNQEKTSISSLSPLLLKEEDEEALSDIQDESLRTALSNFQTSYQQYKKQKQD